MSKIGLILVGVFVSLLAMLPMQTQNKNRVVNRPPVISKFESSDPVIATCLGFHAICERKNRRTVGLVVTATDPENDVMTYEYLPTAGEVLGQGASVSWKLGDQPYATYSVTVKVTDSKGASSSSSLRVSVMLCDGCGIADPPCPIVVVSGGDDVTYRGELLHFHATVQTDYYFETRPDYVWTVTGGKILKGQHTPWIEVETSGEVGEELKATVVVEGLDSACSKEASQSVPIKRG